MRILLAVVALAMLAPCSVAQSPVRVLSFNIRYGTARDGEHVWPNRREHVFATIRDHRPHLVGLQEALRFQLDEIASAVPGYRELGVGRDDGLTRGEYAAILVDTMRFSVLESGQFWFSDTPDVPGSKHWGNSITRLCTWTRLADRITGDTIRVYNQHWDHESQPSREKSAAALLARIAADGRSMDPIVVMGDFNSDETNPAFQALVNDTRVRLRDTFRDRYPGATIVGTFHAFRGDSTQGKIDAILASTHWTVVEAGIDRRRWGTLWASDHFAVSATLLGASSARRSALRGVQQVSFTPVQPELFASGTTFTNAWTDFDSDGDLDLFVGFNGTPNRLYRNDASGFADVAATVGVADARATRATAWGDYDADGNIDLLLGFAPGTESTLKLYRNAGGRFTDVTSAAGLTVTGGAVRQPAWVDYDGDGDLDLFIAFRDRANALFENTGGSFRDVAAERGLADTRRAVGAVWFDADEDGDLDVLIGNMDGDANALFVNDGGRFQDRWALASGTTETAASPAGGGRKFGDATNGTVRPCVADVDADGRLDMFFANYGPNGVFLNRGRGSYEDASARYGIAIDGRYDACLFDDFDNDGRVDFYVNGTVTGGRNYPDYLFRNTGTRFDDVTPENIRALQADHGAQWADYDRDGAIDLALTGVQPTGMHLLLRNGLPDSVRARSLSILVTDEHGRLTRAGAEVRVYAAGTRRVLGTRLVDAGSGYNSQSAGPVHFGLPSTAPVDVEVIFPRGGTRQVSRSTGVDPRAYAGRSLVVRTGGQ